MNKHDRRFDVVIWGAAGFTGKLTAEYLLKQYGLNGQLRWAIAGRNAEKLEQVRQEIAVSTGVKTENLPILVGEANDQVFMKEMAASTRVVCSTVGPYARYGTALVAACAQAGTDYCDLCGEVHWMRAMIDAYHDQAVSTGARIVFSTGFDCIPWDVGAYYISKEMLRQHGVPCSKVESRIVDLKGAPSGGSVATLIAMSEDSVADPEVARLFEEPYSLNPHGQQQGPDLPERKSAWYDKNAGQWATSFLMGVIDTKVVRRSAALLPETYGNGFRYDEGVLRGAGLRGFLKAHLIAFALFALQSLLKKRGFQRIMGRRLKPGQGPSKHIQETGYFKLQILGKHPNDPALNLKLSIRGDRDPGYGSTSKMLGEAAVSLALDPSASGGGCLTPAAAMGDALLRRLPANAGVSFSFEA